MSERVRSKKKKRNPILAYFKPFGLRQICDLTMLAGVIVIFIGIFVSANEAGETVAVIGMSIYALACLMAIFRCFTVLRKKDINKRDPEFKAALINMCVMGVLLALAAFGIIAAYTLKF